MAGIADFAADIVAIAWVMTPGDAFGGADDIANSVFDQEWVALSPVPVPFACERASFVVPPPLKFSAPHKGRKGWNLCDGQKI